MDEKFPLFKSSQIRSKYLSLCLGVYYDKGKFPKEGIRLVVARLE